MRMKLILATLAMLAFLTGCSTTDGVQTANINLPGGGVGAGVKIGATADTPGYTGLVVPDCNPGDQQRNRCSRYKIDGVGGNGYTGDVIKAAGFAAGGALAGALGGGGATATAGASAVAIAKGATR